MSKKEEILEEIKNIESILIKMESDKNSDTKKLMELYKKRHQLIDAYKGLIN